jgi:hypothetical protein
VNIEDDSYQMSKTRAHNTGGVMVSSNVISSTSSSGRGSSLDQYSLNTTSLKEQHFFGKEVRE